jgi:outer membrane receptor protein involved in Fe transport
MIANETRAWVPLGNRFGWVLGSSFTSNTTQLARDLRYEAALASSTGVANRINEFTLYGEASLRLREGLVLTGGGRATWTRLSGSGQDVALDVAKAGAAITARRTETMLLPSAAITAQPTQRMTVYLRYQEGFRPGGLAIDGEFVRRFQNDQTATFEVGLRHGRPGRDRFDIAFSLSHTNWNDIQADFIDRFGLPTTANVGDGRIWTASATLGVMPIDGLRIDGGIVFNNSRISQPNLYTILAISGPFPVIAGPVSDGGPLPPTSDEVFYLDKLTALLPLDQIPNVAKVSARFGFDYRREIGPGLSLHALGSARYVGRSRLGVGPELGDLQGDYLETYLGLRIGRESLGATLSVSNLADAAGNRFSLGTPFAIGREQITPLRPLTVRLGIDAAF